MGANLLPCNAAARLQARTTKRIFSGREAVHRLMAKVIEFYIPNRFKRKVAWVPPQNRGKVIEFCAQVKKSPSLVERPLRGQGALTAMKSIVNGCREKRSVQSA